MSGKVGIGDKVQVSAKEKAKNELYMNYIKTKFNVYPRRKLKAKTGVSIEELKQLETEGVIKRARGKNDTLFVLCEYE